MTAELEGAPCCPRPARPGRTARRLAAVAVLLVAVQLCTFAVHHASAARPAPSELCAGYAPCDATGFNSHGYASAAGQSWWSMYPGINCTNYAAYVESQVYGVPTPDVLLGDAYQWAERAAQAGIPVDQTPTVGAVAVWGAGTPGMGADGHVAVVEAVAPDGSYIDVSQSGMGSANDGYDWERVYRDAGSSWEPWPASFIHFAGPGIPGTLPHAGLRRAGAELVIPGG